MARGRRPQSANLVNFIFGQAQKASGRRGRPEKPISLTITGAPGAGVEDVIQRDVQNYIYGAVEAPAQNIGGAAEFAFKGTLGVGKGMENLMLAAGKNFRYVDEDNRLGRNTGTSKKIYFIDPTSGELVDENGNRMGRNVREVDPYITLMGVDASKSNWRAQTYKQLANWAKTQGGVIGTIGNLADMHRRSGGNLVGALGYIREEAFYPSMMRAKKEDFLKQARANYLARGGVAGGDAFNQYMKAMEQNFDKLIKPSVAFVHDSGKYGAAAQNILGAKDNAQHFHIRYKFDPTAGPIGPDGNPVGQFKKAKFSALAGTPEQLAAADTVKKVYTDMGKGAMPWGPNIINDPWTAFAYSQGFNWVKNITEPNPGKNIGAIFNQFVLTNQGWVKLRSNQWLQYMANTKGGIWMDAWKLADSQMINHWSNKLYLERLNKLGIQIGEAVAKRIAEGLSKFGIRAGSQALGSLAPVVGNVVALLVTELFFKVLDPLWRFIKEVLRAIAWVGFFILGLAFCAIITWFNGIFPDFSIPGRGGAGPAFADDAFPEESNLDFTAVPEGPGSTGTCPFASARAGCTQYLHNSYRGENEMAIDIGFGAGTNVYSPCDGYVVGKRIIYSGNACSGQGGMGLDIYCSNGNYMRILHTVPTRGFTRWNIKKGQHIGKIGAGSSKTATGATCSTGSHAHVACKTKGRYEQSDRCLVQRYRCPDYCGRL